MSSSHAWLYIMVPVLHAFISQMAQLVDVDINMHLEILLPREKHSCNHSGRAILCSFQYSHTCKVKTGTLPTRIST